MDAYRRFKDHLFSGTLRPGQFVSQRELSELLGVSLAPIREAIRQLEAEQLIRVYPQRGIQIAEGDPKTINDGYDYRILLETAAVRAFAADPPLPVIDALKAETEAAIEALESPGVDDAVRRRAVETDSAFHEALIEHLDNEVVKQHYSVNSARIRLFRPNSSQTPQRMGPALREHLTMLDACRRGQADRAAAMLAAHIETSRALTLGLKPRAQRTEGRR